MKKLFTGLLSILFLGMISSLFFSCDTWMKDDDFYSDIERDVKIANAEPISVFVRYAMTRQGKTNPEGYTTFKVGIPHEISATTETEYGFVKWAAFSTSFLSTSNQNGDKLFVDENDYNTRLLPHELSSSVVSFDNPRSPNTNATVNESREDVFIVPIVTERPRVNLTIPARGSNNVVRNMSVRISFTKPMDPSSFREEGVVSITEGSITIIDGDMEIASKDISNLFEEPILSRNGKMLTLKFTTDGLRVGYDSKSTVNISISKEVKDIYGFSMVNDETISFTAGSGMDTIAPRITQLTAGRGFEFGQFQGMYNSNLVMQNLNNTLTKFKLTMGSNDAASKPLSDSFFNSANGIYQAFIKNRVSDKVSIRVYAEDLTGENSTDHLENDVAMVAIRSKALFNADGTAAASSADNTLSMAYIPQGDIAEIGRAVNKLYPRLVQEERARLIANGDNSFDDAASGVGCLFVYDMASINVPDGLIQIDVAAIDNISNNGYTEYTDYTEQLGNGWASVFVVKDTTPPAKLGSGRVSFTRTDNPAVIDLDDFYNAVEYEKLKVSVSGSAITDYGDTRLRSAKVWWIVKPIDDSVTAENVGEVFESAADSEWKEAISANTFQNFTAPSEDNMEGQRFAYALKDDMGNIAADILPEKIKFDCTVPVVGSLEWIADEGSAIGVTTGNVLNNQTLVIPVSEETSGIDKIELSVKHVDSLGNEEQAYASPFGGSFAVTVIKTNGTTQQLSSSDYSIDTQNTKVLKFTNPATDWQTIKIKGLKIANSATEGNYRVRVTVKDAALNETTSAQPIELSNDSTNPVIEKIIVPNINKGIIAGGTTDTYWADYSKLDTSSTIPKTNIYVTFNETNSGANVFDFTDSTINLTSATKIYKAKLNAAGDGFEPDGEELAGTISGKVLTLTSYNDIMRIKGSSVTVIITNVQLARITSTSSEKSGIKLVISDRATNASAEVTSMNSGSNITAAALPLTFTEFSYDTETPSISLNRIADRGTDANSVAADSGFTNETYIDADFKLQETYSGVTALTLDGAVFDETTTIQAYLNGWVTIVNAGDITSAASTVSFNNKIIVGSDISVNVCNIKLLQESGASPSVSVEDGLKTVKLTATSLGGITSTVNNSSTKTITYDSLRPRWNGNGLYTTTQSTSSFTVNPNHVWPHPKAPDVEASQRAYGLKDEVEGNTAGDLYFYVAQDGAFYAAPIRIEADVEELNRNSNSIYIENVSGSTYEGVGTSASNSGPFAYHGLTPAVGANCKFNTYVVDKAGNKSDVITFHIIIDSIMQNDSEDLNSYIEIEAPDGFEASNMHKNPVRSSTLQNTNNGYEYTVRDDLKPFYISTYDYVLKKFDANPYKIRIKLGNGTGCYGKAGETTSSAPIEKYSVTHLYDNFSSTYHSVTGNLTASYLTGEFIPASPGSGSNGKATWIDYKTGETSPDGTDITSAVDSNGDIVITLPNRNCPPLSLWLKDGCGNEGYVLIRPGLAAVLGNSSLANYEHVGWIIDGEVQQGTKSMSYTGVTKKTFGDVLYYKGTPVLSIDNSDSALFNSSDTGYTLRTKLISWSGAGATGPEKNDFEADTGTWTSIKATSQSSFRLDLNLPTPSPNTAASELWYIMEDTVGNCSITKLTDGTATKWMYDNEGPVPDVNSSEYVNTITTDGPADSNGNPTGINYYSANSTVTYKITDEGSGIYNDGDRTYLDSERQQEITKSSYDISSRLPDSSMKITISGIEDFVGNTSSMGFTKNNVSNWLKQSVPELDLSASNLNNSQLTAKIEAGDHNSGMDNWNDWGISRSYTASDKTYRITATKYRYKMYVKLNAKWHENDSSSYTTSESKDLLGWIVRTTPLSDTASNPADKFKSFYSASLVGSEITSISDNKYLFEKTDDTEWNSFAPVTYFYPVNKAGLICKTPVIVRFEANVSPSIKSNTLSYPDVGSYVNGNEKINYLKATSKFKFTTNDNTLSKCDIMIGGQYSNDKWTYTNSSTGLEKNGYEYTLDLSKLGTDISGKELWVKLYTETESTTYRIFGPSGANNWTYDATAPDFALAASNPVTKVESTGELWQNSSTNVYYFSSNNVKVSFDYSATDIIKFEAKIEREDDTSTPDFTDITSSFDKTNKTYTLNGLEEGKLYTITFRAIDKAENPTTLTALKLQKDTTAPTGTVSHTLAKASSGAPVENTHYNIKTGTEDGAEKQTIYFRNSGTDRLTTVTISVSSPSDSGSGLNSVYYTIDGGTETALTGSYNLPVSLSEGLEATYKIYVKDNLGNSKLLKTYVVNGNGPAGTVSFTQITGTKLSAGTAEDTDTIYYNASDITEVQLAVSGVQDSRGNTNASTENAVKIFYQKGSATPVDISGTLKLPCPAGDTNNTATYTVYAEDSLGNKKTLRKYVLNGKLPSGAVTYSAEAGTAIDGTDSSIIYFKSTGSDAVAKINLTSTVKNAEENNAALYYQIDDGALVPMTGTELPCPGSSVSYETTYKIYAKDSIGNTSAVLATFTLKGAAPTGSIDSYVLKKDSATAVEVSDSAPGDYIASVTQDSNNVITAVSFIYNPAKVNKITITPGTITDCGSGSSIVMTIDGNYEMDGSNIKTYSTSSAFDIVLGSDWTTKKVYRIFVRDAAGNETRLIKYEFKAHGSAPVVDKENEKIGYTGLAQVPTYPGTYSAGNKSNWIKSFANNDPDYSVSPTPVELKSGKIKVITYNDGVPNSNTSDVTDYVIRQVDANTKFTLPVKKSSLPSEKLYYGITYGSIKESDVEWNGPVDVSGGKLTNISLDMSKISKLYTFIFVWYKDELGNICVHNLVFYSTEGYAQNWWTKADYAGDVNTGDSFVSPDISIDRRMLGGAFGSAWNSLVGAAETTASTVSSVAVTYTEPVTSSVYNIVREITVPLSSVAKSASVASAKAEIMEVPVEVNISAASSVTSAPVAVDLAAETEAVTYAVTSAASVKKASVNSSRASKTIALDVQEIETAQIQSSALVQNIVENEAQTENMNFAGAVTKVIAAFICALLLSIGGFIIFRQNKVNRNEEN